MHVRRAATTFGTAAFVTLAGCGGGSDSPDAASRQTPSVNLSSPSSSPSPTPYDGSARGLVAVGHSGLTGYASDPKYLTSDAPANSWATGDNPEVDSIYLRLAEADPDSYKGYVANYAVSGSTADTLEAQVTAALKEVTTPKAMIIQTIDNDVTCDGNDAANYRPFGQLVKHAMTTVTHVSPKVTVLLLATPGRPLEYAKVAMGSADARRHFSSDEPCSLLTSKGKLNLPEIRRLTRIIEGYEAAEERVCAQLKQCVYVDETETYQDTLTNLAKGDWDHFSVAGNAAFAAHLWPTIKRRLDVG